MTTHILNTKILDSERDYYFLGVYILDKVSWTAVDYDDFPSDILENIKISVKNNQIQAQGYTQDNFLAYIDNVIVYITTIGSGGIGNVPDASSIVKGVVLLSVDPTIVTMPTAVGINDPLFTNALQSTNNLSDITSPSTARNNLGLGSAATNNTTDFDLAGAAATVQTNLNSHTGNTSNPHATTKAQVGLSNVENTALSTWNGSTNINTLGTITTGSIPSSLITGLGTISTQNANSVLITGGSINGTSLGLISQSTAQVTSLGVNLVPGSIASVSISSSSATVTSLAIKAIASQTAAYQRFYDSSDNILSTFLPIGNTDPRTKLNFYNTLETTLNNFERGSIYFDNPNNLYRIETQIGGTGTLRALALQVGGGRTIVGGTSDDGVSTLQVNGTLIVTGNVTLGDASADSIIQNAGTITINNSYLATHTVASAAAGTTNDITQTVAITQADAGGTTTFNAFLPSLTLAGANAYTTARLFLGTATYSASANIANLQTYRLNAVVSGTGGITNGGFGYTGSLAISGGSTVASWSAFSNQPLSITSGTCTLYNDFLGTNSVAALTSTQFRTTPQTASSVNTHYGFYGIISAPTAGGAHYNVYVPGLAPNYFAGFTGHSGASVPAAVLHLGTTAISAPAWTTAGIGLRIDQTSYTDTSSTGTIAFQIVNQISAPSLIASNPVTYTVAATLNISGPPTQGVNATIGSAYALRIGTGGSLFGGLVTGTGGLTFTGGIANVNVSSNFATNLNTGTSTGTVTIGNAANTTTVASKLTAGATTQSGAPATGLSITVPGLSYTDNSTAGSGTSASIVSGVSITQASLAATNTLVTQGTAIGLSLGGPVRAGTNETITTSYALFINAGQTVSNGGSVGTAWGLFVQAPSGATTANYAFGVLGAIQINNNNNPLNFNTGTSNGTVTVGGGSGSVVLNGASGSIDGLTIGVTTPATARFTTLTMNSNTSAISSASANGVIGQIGAITVTDTVTAASGSASFINAFLFGQCQLNATNTSVTTNLASTVTIYGAPKPGTNQTITNSVALFISNASTLAGGTATNGYGLYVQATIGASSNNAALFSGAVTIQSGTFTSSGGIINQNVSSNFATNINTGTSTGTVTIGNASCLINLNASVSIASTLSVITPSNIGLVFTALVGNPTTNSAIYSSDVTPSASNYALSTSLTVTTINGPTTLALNVGGAGRATFSSSTTAFVSNVFNVNVSSNFATNINTGTSTGAVTIGNAANTTTVSSKLSAGISVQSGAPTANGISFVITAATYTDNTTAASGTAAASMLFSNWSQPTLGATNTSVSQANTATLNISGPVRAGTNELITNSYGVLIAGGSTVANGGTVTNAYSVVIQQPTGASNNYALAVQGALQITNNNFPINLNVGTSNGTVTVGGSSCALVVSASSSTFLLSGNTGIVIQNLVSNTVYGAIYASGLTNSITNYALATSGAVSNLNGTTSSSLCVGGTSIVIAAATLVTISQALTVSSGIINLNVSSNFTTNINTGTSTGTTTIGNALNTTTVLSGFFNYTPAGITFPAGANTVPVTRVITGTPDVGGTSSIVGMSDSLTLSGSSNAASAQAYSFNIFNNNTGTTGTLGSFNVGYRAGAAGISNVAYGVASVPVLTAGNFVAARNFWSRGAVISGTGTITTHYGLYIDPLTIAGVTTGYGIYQTGTSDLNVFFGPIQARNDIKFSTVGNGFYIKEGTNATMGTGTLVAGTLTISNTKVTSTSRIFVCRSLPNGTLGDLGEDTSARVVGTSFTIKSMSLAAVATVAALDTSSFVWFLLEPA